MKTWPTDRPIGCEPAAPQQRERSSDPHSMVTRGEFSTGFEDCVFEDDREPHGVGGWDDTPPGIECRPVEHDLTADVDDGDGHGEPHEERREWVIRPPGGGDEEGNGDRNDVESGHICERSSSSPACGEGAWGLVGNGNVGHVSIVVHVARVDGYLEYRNRKCAPRVVSHLSLTPTIES